MPYKDKEQQKAAIKVATQRYRLKRKGITTAGRKGITVIPCDTVTPDGDVIPDTPTTVAPVTPSDNVTVSNGQPLWQPVGDCNQQPEPLTKEQQVKGFYK